MFISRRGGSDDQQTPALWRCKLSTYPRQFYVSYLTADELAACVARIDQQLSTGCPQLPREKAALLRDVKKDMLRELGSRQTSLTELLRELEDQPNTDNA